MRIPLEQEYNRTMSNISFLLLKNTPTGELKRSNLLIIRRDLSWINYHLIIRWTFDNYDLSWIRTFE